VKGFTWLIVLLSCISAAHANSRFNFTHSFNYAGAGPSDLGIMRGGQFWYFAGSQSNLAHYSLGDPGDVAIAGDYDGDGKTDYAIFRPSTVQFWWVTSSDGVLHSATIGDWGDSPVVADFDGDGKTDIVVYRPKEARYWYYQSSNGLLVSVPVGPVGGLAVIGDFDGDGKDEPAAFDSATATFIYSQSSNGAARTVHLGQAGDTPLTGDFDGDGKADPAVYHSATSTFTYRRSSDDIDVNIQLGQHSDVPITGDFDGDGKTDVAVFRQGIAASNQFLYRSSSTAQVVTSGFGNPHDVPLGGRYQPDEQTSGLTYQNETTAVKTYYQSGVPHTDKAGVFQPSVDSDSFFPRCAFETVTGMLADMKNAGFNCVKPYIALPLTDVLAEASKAGGPLGIQVIGQRIIGNCGGSGNPACDPTAIINSSVCAGCEITVNANHPNLLGWDLEDEASSCVYLESDNCPVRWNNYRQYASAIGHIGTSHPIFNLDSSAPADSETVRIAEWHKWNTSARIVVNDRYPFAAGTEASLVDSADAYARIQDLFTTSGTAAPVWITLQSFQTAPTGTFHWKMPTPLQLRAQVFTALIHGATGIIYFTIDSAISRAEGNIGIAPDPPECYLPPEQQPPDDAKCAALPPPASSVPAHPADRAASRALWNATMAGNSELARLQDVLLTPTSNVSYQVGVQGSADPSVAPVRSMLKKSSTGVYTLLVINLEAVAVNAQFSLPTRPVDLYLIDSDGARYPRTPYGSVFQETIEGFGARVYEFK
jgi:hypothetical protein